MNIGQLQQTIELLRQKLIVEIEVFKNLKKSDSSINESHPHYLKIINISQEINFLNEEFQQRINAELVEFNRFENSKNMAAF